MHDTDQRIEIIFKKDIEKRSEELLNEAKMFVDLFYEAKREYTKQYSGRSDYKTPHLGCRVRQNGNNSPGIFIEWYRNEYYGAKGNKKTRSVYIRLPKSGTYHKSAVFDWRTLSWEERSFGLIEPEFQRLRLQSKALGRLSKSINMYSNTVKKLDWY